MARTEDRKFGAFGLTAANGISIESLQGSVTRKTSFDERVRGEGGLVTEDRATGHQVEMSGAVVGTDAEEAAARLDAFLAALHQGEDWLQVWDDRRLRCRLSGEVSWQLVRGTGGSVYRWDCKMRSRWPYWEGTATTVDNSTPTGAGPHNLVVTDVGGNGPVPPTITITSLFTFDNKVLTLTAVSTLERLQLIGLSMNSGQAIVVDMRGQRLGDGLSASVTPRSIEGQFWSLPGGTAHVVEFAHNVGASASWTVAISHVPRWRNP